jgi:diguanylate cyclase (GGDEF)-like protein/PAS domain S-box-containing protein
METWGEQVRHGTVHARRCDYSGIAAALADIPWPVPPGGAVKRTALLTLLMFLGAEGALAWYLKGLYDAELEQCLGQRQTELDTGLRSVINGYGQLVDVVVRTELHRPEVLTLLSQGVHADPDQAPQLRGRLYRLLYPTYSILREHDVRVLHFVRPDGTSFLRFNRPDLFDDDIAADRPLLRAVIDSGRPGHAFENGHLYPGFRYAYPLHEGQEGNRRLIAVADLAISFDAVRRVLQESGAHTGTHTRFILHRALFDLNGNPSTRTLFRPVTRHPDFVTEDEESSLRDTKPSLSMPPWVDEVERQLAHDRGVQGAIAAGTPYAVLACTTLDACYAVALLPVLDSAQRVAGFLATYSPAPELAVTRDHLLLAFLAGTLPILVAGLALRRALASGQRLRTISEHMAEGLYVIDSGGVTIYANAMASDLLGYANGELVGHLAHDLIHAPRGQEAVRAGHCPMRLAAERGEVYRSDHEAFRRKDGRLLRVSLVSSPLREEGRVTGTVVLFRDIGTEHEARMRLRQADVAFSHLAEAVVVTDAEARIQAVNPAFTQITGYTEEEVRGKSPKILASGRHDHIYYQRMWRSILDLGYWEGEIWNKRKNGEIYPEILKITAVRDEQHRIAGFVSVFRDIAELRAKEKRLRHLAYRDQLTGLYNRNAFMRIFEHALHRARDRGARLALLYMDIDRFKRINDTLGHVIGDALLRKVARRIRTTLRAQDEAARLGGDEFVVLLEDIDQQVTPVRVAHALLERIRAPLAIDGNQLHVTSSIGICVYPEDGDSPTALLKNADAAMYLAKQSGRDACRYFTATMASEADARFEVETRLREALTTGQMRLLYQPKVALADGQVLGLEALVRWQHPGDGLLWPDCFLPIAADAGLMQALTRWVVAEASRQCALWRADGLAFGRIACNLNASIVLPSVLEAMLLEAVAEAGITPMDLELEVLEAGMLKEAQSQGLWGRLVTHGFELSIDDFGTGESSLARIKELPVSTLKIDRSFIHDLETNDDDRSIVRTVIAMTKTLGKQALAEGVETDAQLRFLIEAGCDAAQGYWFSRPLPPEQIPELVRSGRCRDRLLGIYRTVRPA